MGAQQSTLDEDIAQVAPGAAPEVVCYFLIYTHKVMYHSKLK